jgi:hypothetical protein
MRMDGRWLFYQDDGALWHWEEYDVYAKLLNKAKCGFSSMAGCVIDAAAHGYSGPALHAAVAEVFGNKNSR